MEPTQIIAAIGGLNVAKRVFGPSLDEAGEVLRRVTEWKLRNVGRVIERANAKSAGQRDDAAPPPRAALAILDQACVAEDEVMADYLGGVLASARESGGDDAVAWTALIARMSSRELRMHYALYSAYRRAVRGATLNLQKDADRRRAVFVPVSDADGLYAALGPQPQHDIATMLVGLLREGLIDNNAAWAVGDVSMVQTVVKAATEPGVAFSVALQGMFLYAWGAGFGGRGVKALAVFTDLGLPEVLIPGLVAPRAILQPALEDAASVESEST